MKEQQHKRSSKSKTWEVLGGDSGSGSGSGSEECIIAPSGEGRIYTRTDVVVEHRGEIGGLDR